MITIRDGYTRIKNEIDGVVDTTISIRLPPINRISPDIEERIRPLLEEVEAIILRQK